MLLQLFVPHSFTYKLQYFNVYQVQKNRLGGWTTVKIVRKAALYNRGKIHSFRHLRLLYNLFFLLFLVNLQPKILIQVLMQY